jgi:FMN phosphatase YigB (HAD superfamily)
MPPTAVSPRDVACEEEKNVSLPTDRDLTARTPRLRKLHRMIADGSCSVLSLDIFDTVLWRRVPRPTDLFAVVGARLRRDGRSPDWLTDAAFRAMRITAERESRMRRGSLGTEVSLYDIWEEMPLDLFGGATIEELVATEVAVERAFTVVDLEIAEVIALARAKGVPTVLVSDTYFTEEHLAHLLDRPELGPLDQVRVFRSHQHGRDKASGLWKIVLEELGVKPEQVVHIGDNFHADVEAPGWLGVRTVFYERIDRDFGAILEREKESLDSFGPFGAGVHPELGDFGLTSLRAKTLALQPTGGVQAVQTAWRYGAGVLGPVLTGFAEWVAERAEAAGTQVVWCPMREGTVLSQLINNAAQARGWKVEARPIWLSRHVTSIAALDASDPDELYDFIAQRYQLTVRQLLETLSLRPGEVSAVAEILDTVLDNHGVVLAVRDALTEAPHLRNRLAVTVMRSRERLLTQLRQAGALDQPDLALVDLGWGGTIQYFLSKVLAIAQTGVKAAGYYLVTDERSTRVNLQGLHMEAYLAQSGHPRAVVSTVVRSPEVLEQCVNDLCGSLIDLTDDGEPVLGPYSDTPSQAVERRSVQEGVFTFQRQWNRYAETDPDWPTLSGAARERLANILVSAIKQPTAAEAAVFGNWQHEDNFGSAAITNVLPSEIVPAIPYMSPNDILDLNMRDAFWPALISASDIRLGEAARALAAGSIDPAMFETSDEPSDTALKVQTADGVWHAGPRRRVRINHNGLSFARLDFTSRDGDVETLSLAVPGRPALARIDWIEVKAILAGSAEPVVARWDGPEDFAGLIHYGCTWLGGNMFEFEFDEAAIWLPVSARTGGPVSSGQVTVAFAMLPKSRTGLGRQLPAAARLVRMSNRIREEYKMRGPVGLATSAVRMTTRQLKSGQ